MKSGGSAEQRCFVMSETGRPAALAVLVAPARPVASSLNAPGNVYGLGRLVPIRRGYAARFSGLTGFVVRR